MRQCDDEYPWLSEFLCEYVDGTMHPSARSAFDECLRGNPALRRHVRRLQATRQALCSYGCDVHAPCNLRDQLHARLAGEGLLADLATTSPALLPTAARARALWLWAPALLGLFCLAAVGLLVLPDEADALLVTGEVSPDAAEVPVVGVAGAASVSLRVPHERPAATRADSVRRAMHFNRGGASLSLGPAGSRFAATSMSIP